VAAITGAAAVGVFLGSLRSRSQETKHDVSIDGVKEALVRLKTVVQILESTVGIKFPDEEPQSTGQGLFVTTTNLKQVEGMVVSLTSRIQNATDHIPSTGTEKTDGDVTKTDTDHVPRIITVSESEQGIDGDNRQVSTGENARVQFYPASRVPSAAEFHDSNQSSLIDFYNQAVENRNIRGEFQERFHPLRIGTINASDRRRDPSLPPEYREASDGNFLAIEDSRRMSYLIVPRFDLTIKETNYGAGAIGTIFNCSRWDPLLSYSRVTLERPAVFEKSGEIWLLKTPGVLDLGQGD